MAIAAAGGAEVSAQAVSSVTVSLTEGWDEVPENGPPAAGDVVVLEVVKPETGVTGPPGWTAAGNGRVFWRQVGARERDPVFHGVAPEGWQIRGKAFSGFASWSGDGSDAGSAVPWPELGGDGASG